MWQCTPTSSTDVRPAGTVDRPQRVAVAEVEAELRVVLARGDELVGVGVHAGGDPQQTFGAGPTPAAASASRRSSSSKESTTMWRTPLHDRHAQFVDRLVVAVQRTGRGRHAGGEGDVQLAAGGDVEQQSFVVRQLRHRLAQERLGRVDHPLVTEGGDRLAAPVAQVGLVVHEQRRAELGGQVGDRARRRRAASRRAPTAAVSDRSRRGIELTAN